MFAKKGGGLMASYIVKNRLTDSKGLKHFKENGYRFEPALSGEDRFVFVR